MSRCTFGKLRALRGARAIHATRSCQSEAYAFSPPLHTCSSRQRARGTPDGPSSSATKCGVGGLGVAGATVATAAAGVTGAAVSGGGVTGAAVSGSAVVAATVESSSGVGAALEPPGSGTGSDVDGAALVSSSVARSRARPFLLALGALNEARSSSSSWRSAPCFVRLPGDAITAGATIRASSSVATRIFTRFARPPTCGNSPSFCAKSACLLGRNLRLVAPRDDSEGRRRRPGRCALRLRKFWSKSGRNPTSW